MAIEVFLQEEQQTATKRMSQIDHFLVANLGSLEDSEARRGLYNLRKKAEIVGKSAEHLLNLIRYEMYDILKPLKNESSW